MVLALGRTNPLKNLPLTLDAWRALPRAAARAVPVRDRAGAGRRARASATSSRPSDEQVNELFNRGDGVRPDLDARGLLPAAAGGDGDRRRGRLHRRARQPRLLRRRRELPDARARRRRRWRGARAAARRPASCASGSGERGIETARDYAWERRIDALEAFFERVAAARTDGRGGGAGAASRLSRARVVPASSLQVLGDGGASRLKTQKPSDEDRERRCASGAEQRGPAAEHLTGAERGVVDHRVAELLEDRRPAG